jgi:photosystem II stability/assembly factor-like uncharacterized protein
VPTVTRRLRWAALLALPASVLSACGGSSSESGLELSPLDTSPPTTTTTIPTSGPAVTTPGVPGSSTPGTPTTAAPVMKWTEVAGNLVGLTSDCGNVAVDARPGQDMVIAFVNTHGLFSAPSNSDQWTPLGTGVDNRMTQIVADPDPANAQTFWESGSYGTHGVYRTDDNGTTFDALGDVAHVDYISIDFTDPDRATILAGGHESSTVHVTKDGGATWDELPGLPADVGFTSSPYVIDANTFLVGSYQGPGSGVYRSTDAGQSWEKVFDGPVVGPVIDTAGKLRLLQQNGAGVITSTDGGVTWTAKPAGGVLAQQAVELLALPDGSIASWSPTGVVVSADDGQRWRRLGPNTPYEPKGLAYSATGSLYVYRWECDFNSDNPVGANSILRLDPA